MREEEAQEVASFGVTWELCFCYWPCHLGEHMSSWLMEPRLPAQPLAQSLLMLPGFSAAGSLIYNKFMMFLHPDPSADACVREGLHARRHMGDIFVA